MRTVKPMTKEIAADHQLLSPAASQITQIRPVNAAIVTNHSPRMNCLGGTPLLTSLYHRPAVGPMTASARTARMGRCAFSAASAPAIAYHGREKEVMNWNSPSRNNWPEEKAIR